MSYEPGSTVWTHCFSLKYLGGRGPLKCEVLALEDDILTLTSPEIKNPAFVRHISQCETTEENFLALLSRQWANFWSVFDGGVKALEFDPNGPSIPLTLVTGDPDPRELSNCVCSGRGCA